MISDALRKIVDEAVEELDQSESRYLIERVCADVISALIDQAQDEQTRAMLKSALEEWKRL